MGYDGGVTKTNHSGVVDLLRLAAISQVLLAHISLHTGLVFEGWLKPWWGYYREWGNGVTLFLIVSGISLALAYPAPVRSWREFMVKRLKRLLPVYFFSLAAGILVYYGLGWRVAAAGADFGPAGELKNAICSLTATCPLWGLWGGWWLPTSWFMVTIVGLYALYPWLASRMLRQPWLWLGLTMITAMISRSYLYGHREDWPLWAFRWFPLARVGEFGLGMFLAGLLPAKLWRWPWPGRVKGSMQTLARLTLPVFLVHFSFLPLIPLLMRQGISQNGAVVIYGGVVLGLSRFMVDK